MFHRLLFNAVINGYWKKKLLGFQFLTKFVSNVVSYGTKFISDVVSNMTKIISNVVSDKTKL